MLIEISASESSDIIAACLIAERAGVVLGCHTPIMNELPRIRAKLAETLVDHLLPVICKYKNEGRSISGKIIVSCTYGNGVLMPICAVESGDGVCPLQELWKKRV